MTGISTTSIHADQVLNRVNDVVPPINTSTTFRYADDPNDIKPATEYLVDGYDPSVAKPIYSRLGHPNSTRVEKILGEIIGGECIAYNSGLSAFFAAIMYFNPKVVAIGDGYHGCHGILNLLKRNYNIKIVSLDQLDQLSKGDLIHLETPENPYSIVHDIQYYVNKAKEIGSFILVDATFAPPPLSNPFDFGVDMILHSATKYFGGHSDLLAGCLVTKDPKIKIQLANDRVFLGTNIANLEAYLLLRSLRTYELRIKKQSENATKIVKFLNENKKSYPSLAVIHHSSLQKDDFVAKQMVGGHSPVFSIELNSAEKAKSLPSKLKFFQHATSLGGVESLIEWRAVTDSHARPTLLRVSCGIENVEDLIADFDNALKE
jgi:cystathionine gamma-synthase